MKATCVFLLCILGANLLSTVLCQNANGPSNCCFTYYPYKVRRDLISSYNVTDHRCPKAGVMFVIANTGQRICMDPSVLWVKKTMEILDKKSLK